MEPISKTNEKVVWIMDVHRTKIYEFVRHVSRETLDEVSTLFNNDKAIAVVFKPIRFNSSF